MEKSFFEEYHHKQKQIIESIAARLTNQKIVKHYSDVYPDLYNKIGSNRGIAYIRGSVPLKLVSLIYDTVIVFIPPISKEKIESRFQLKYGDFIRLCQQNIVIPILGDVFNYTDDHFKEIFDLPSSPPSLWARGLGLLDVFGMNDCLEFAKGKLPVEKIVNDKKVLKYYDNYNRKNIKERIRKDVALFYADLCIFGCESDIEIIKEFSEPSEIYESLEMMNEIKTYPILFGLGSQPNYNPDKMRKIVLENKKFKQLPIPDELGILLDGIGINAGSISVDEIIKYHQTDLGKHLRNALSSFNEYCNEKLQYKKSLDIYTYCDKAELFQTKLKEAINELTFRKWSSLDNTQRAITNIIKCGGISIGGIPAVPAICDGDISQIAMASVPLVFCSLVSLASFFPEMVASKIMKLGVNIGCSGVLANMWSARQTVNETHK